MPGAAEAAHRVPDDLGHRLGDHRHRDLQRCSALNAKTGIISRRLIPDGRADRPGRHARRCRRPRRRDRLRLHEPRARSRSPRAPSRGGSIRRRASRRPVSQGANPFSDMLATEALEARRRVPRARRAATRRDDEARTEMMYAAMLAGIAFNAAGCHLPHGLSYAVSGLAQRLARRTAIPTGKTLVPHGMAVVLNNPSVWRATAPRAPQRHLHGAHCLGADARGARPERMRARCSPGASSSSCARPAMPNGLSALGFDESAPRRARDRRRAAVPRDPQRADRRRARRPQGRCSARRSATGSRARTSVRRGAAPPGSAQRARGARGAPAGAR